MGLLWLILILIGIRPRTTTTRTITQIITVRDYDIFEDNNDDVLDQLAIRYTKAYVGGDMSYRQYDEKMNNINRDVRITRTQYIR